MVQKSNSGGDVMDAGAFDTQRSSDVGLLCIALECGFSHSPSSGSTHECFKLIDVFDNRECPEASEYPGDFSVARVMWRGNANKRNTGFLRTARIINRIAQIPEILFRMCALDQVQAIWSRLWIRNRFIGNERIEPNAACIPLER